MPLRPGFGPAYPELEPFLLAEIGDDRNGLAVTVQSALARLDLDPQTEAVRIYEQSREAAVRSLTDLIETLPEDGSWTKFDARELATDLLTLMPNGRRRQAEPIANGAPPGTAPRITFLRLLICAAFAGLVAFAIWGMPGGAKDYIDLSSRPPGALALSTADHVPASTDRRAHTVEGTSAHALAPA